MGKEHHTGRPSWVPAFLVVVSILSVFSLFIILKGIVEWKLVSIYSPSCRKPVCIFILLNTKVEILKIVLVILLHAVTIMETEAYMLQKTCKSIKKLVHATCALFYLFFFKPYVYARNRLKFVLLFTENLFPHTAVKLYGSLLLQWKLPNKNVFYLFHWSKSRRGLKWHENE